tara:strand:- start:76 stop:240 length:165 start_codon:yes stop_codon:yes gene_type:complete
LRAFQLAWHSATTAAASSAVLGVSEVRKLTPLPSVVLYLVRVGVRVRVRVSGEW